MAQAALSAIAPPDLSRSRTEPRSVRNLVLTGGAWAVAIIAGIPLLSVLYMLIVNGGARLSTELFTELPPAGFEMGGGFGNAIVGTLLMVGIAALISIPLGILAAVYLAEIGPQTRLAATARFLAKVLGTEAKPTKPAPAPRPEAPRPPTKAEKVAAKKAAKKAAKTAGKRKSAA